MTCHDGCTPEVARALGYNGCEVICHPVALQEVEGVSAPWDFWMFSRRTRAHDNMAICWDRIGVRSNMRIIRAPSALDTRSSSTTPAWCCGKPTTLQNRSSRPPSISNPYVSIAPDATTTPGWMLEPKVFGRSMTNQFIRPIASRPGRPPRTLADKMGPVSDVFCDLYGRGQFTPPAGLSIDDMPKQHEARIRHAQTVGALRRE